MAAILHMHKYNPAFRCHHLHNTELFNIITTNQSHLVAITSHSPLHMQTFFMENFYRLVEKRIEHLKKGVMLKIRREGLNTL